MTKTWNRSAIGFTAMLAVSVFANVGCGPNDRILRSSESNDPSITPTATVQQIDEYVREVEAMRTAALETVFSIRRRDGQPFAGDDRNVIRVNTALANRRVVGYDEKWAVIGTNNKLTPENMKVLGERFAITTYAQASDPPESPTDEKTPESK